MSGPSSVVVGACAHGPSRPSRRKRRVHRRERSWRPAAEGDCQGTSCGAEWSRVLHTFTGGRIVPEYYLVEARRVDARARPHEQNEEPRRFCADCWEEKLLAKEQALARFEATDGATAPDETAAGLAPAGLESDAVGLAPEARAEILEKLADPAGGFQPAECELLPESQEALEREILRVIAIQTCPFLLGAQRK